MAKKFLDNTGLSHLIDLIQGMPDDQTIGYTTEAGLHVLDGGITPDKISSLQQLRYEMGLGNTLGALPIENGGTGLTSEAAIKEWLESLLDLSGGGGGEFYYAQFSAHADSYSGNRVGTVFEYDVYALSQQGFTPVEENYSYSKLRFDHAGTYAVTINMGTGDSNASVCLYIKDSGGSTKLERQFPYGNSSKTETIYVTVNKNDKIHFMHEKINIGVSGSSGAKTISVSIESRSV